MKLQDSFEQCMRGHWRGTRGEKTAQINGQAALDFFGGASPLKSIHTQRLDQYVRWLADRGAAPATVNRKLAVLSKILHYAVQRRELATMPHIPYQRAPSGRLRWVTVEEERKVLEFLNSHGMVEHAQAVEMLIDTGLRPSELWRLSARDYSAGALFVRGTKNDVLRVIPLTQRATCIVEQRLVEFGDQLFPHDNAWMIYGWNKAKRAIGLGDDKEFLVYTLRHTCASRLAQKDVPLATIKQWMGHTSLATTLRYVHLSVQNLERARNTLEVTAYYEQTGPAA